MKNKKRGLLTSLGAAAAALAFALGGASAAFAAPTTIDPDAKVNLNIVKLSTPDGAPLTPTGKVQAVPAGSTPIGGVEFTVKRITNAGDLTTNAGWQEAATVVYDAVTGTWTKGGAAFTPAFGTAQVSVTDANGVPRTGPVDGNGHGTGAAAYQNMDIGLYFVEETDTPPGVTPAVPFVVALPMTDPVDLNAWLYTVHVYPKNSQQAFTKTVVDTAAFVPGGTNDVVWTLNASVPRVNTSSNPAIPAWAKPTAFTITDKLDEQLATVLPAAVTVNITDSAGNNIGTQPVSGTDYTLGITGTPQVVTVTFIGANDGFAKLQAAAATPNAKVVVTITSQVQAPVSGTVADTNGGVVSNGGGSGHRTETSLVTTVNGDTTTLYTASVESKWQNVVFSKVSNATTAVPLEDAVFALYASEANAKAGTSALVTSDPSAAVANNVALNNVRVSDFQNGATVALLADYRVYWLAETVAPEGYELLAEPIPVVLLSDGSVQRVTLDGSGRPTAQSPIGNGVNVPHNAGFQLPLTGGMGTAILTVLGVGILAVVLVVARRRRSAEAAE
mgnify:CR=1 FL=1